MDGRGLPLSNPLGFKHHPLEGAGTLITVKIYHTNEGKYDHLHRYGYSCRVFPSAWKGRFPSWRFNEGPGSRCEIWKEVYFHQRYQEVPQPFRTWSCHLWLRYGRCQSLLWLQENNCLPKGPGKSKERRATVLRLCEERAMQSCASCRFRHQSQRWYPVIRKCGGKSHKNRCWTHSAREIWPGEGLGGLVLSKSR